jgi:hypothetical protein
VKTLMCSCKKSWIDIITWLLIGILTKR